MTPPSHPLQDGSLDPLALLRRSRGDNDLRDTKLRLLWLRQQEPEAQVRTRLVSLDERGVVMSARIALPGGGSASAHAASAIDGEIDRIVAETELRALAGALDALGYIVTDTDAERAPATPAPVEAPAPPEIGPAEPPRRQPPGHVQAIRSLREREHQPSPAGPADPRERAEERPAPVEPTPARSPQRGPAPVERRPPSIETAPVDLNERRRPTVPEPDAPPPATDDEDPELEDISWTAFWEWARATYQIRSRGQVESLLGMPVDRESPAQLRQLLIAHFEAESGREP